MTRIASPIANWRQYRITQEFGANPAAYARFGLAGHEGLDWSMPQGTPVRAAHDGQVTLAVALTSYGQYLQLMNDEVMTIYAHLSRFAVEMDQQVNAGEVIGYSGNTGNSTGPHLHFGVYPLPRDYENGYKGAIDPLPLLLAWEETMPSKLTFQIQNPTGWQGTPEKPGWLKTHILTSGVKMVKIMDPDACGSDPLPGIKTIGRLYFPNDSDHPLIRRGAAGAREYVAWCLPRIERASWVYAWEGPNEPEVSDLESCRWLNEFEYERIQQFHARGLRTVSYSLGTSHPAGPASDPLPTIQAKWRALQPAAAITDYLGLHEYGMRTLDPTPLNQWHIGHYKRGVEVLRSMGRVPPVLITEFGVDYSGNPQLDGWQQQLGGDEALYMRQLAARDAEYAADPQVHGVFIFIWHPHPGQWSSFVITESMSSRIVDHIRSRGAFDPGTPAADTSEVERAIAAAAQRYIIPRTPGYALYEAGKAKGYMEASPEFDVGEWRAQAFRQPGAERWQHVAYCRIGDWGHIHWITVDNATHEIVEH